MAFFYTLKFIPKGYLNLFQNTEVKEEKKDERSVDEILSFINGDEGVSRD